MSTAPPFVDPSTQTIDTDQIKAEVIPLTKLIGLFVGLALIPTTLAFLLGPTGTLPILLMVASQFILAIGAGIVLMYVISRGMALSGA